MASKLLTWKGRSLIKRLFAALTLFMMLLVSTACLGGDKIAGTWIGRTDHHKFMTSGQTDDIMICEIKKNGDSYVMNYHYLRLGKDGWFDVDGQKGLGATLKGNLISVLLPGITFNMNYIEKDKTIQFPPIGLNLGGVVLERDEDGQKLESLKNDILKEYKEKQENKGQ